LNKNLHKLHGMKYAYMFSLPKHPPDINNNNNNNNNNDFIYTSVKAFVARS